MCKRISEVFNDSRAWLMRYGWQPMGASLTISARNAQLEGRRSPPARALEGAERISECGIIDEAARAARLIVSRILWRTRSLRIAGSLRPPNNSVAQLCRITGTRAPGVTEDSRMSEGEARKPDLPMNALWPPP